MNENPLSQHEAGPAAVAGDRAEHSKRGLLTRRTIAGFKWSYASLILQGTLQLTVLSVLARLLSPREFGIFGIGTLFTSLVERVGYLGVGPTLVQRGELTELEKRVATSLSLGLGMLLCLLLVVSAPLIAAFFNEPEVVPVLSALSLVFLIDSLASVAESLLQRDLRFRALLVVQNSAYFVGNGLIGITAAYFGMGVWSLVVSTLGQRLLKAAMLMYLQPLRPSFVFPKRETLSLLSVGFGFSLGRLLSYFALTGDNFIVGKLMGPAALGLYGRAYQLMQLPASYFGQVLEKVLFPAMARKQQEQAQLKKVFIFGVELSALVGIPASLVMFLVTPELVLVFFGPNWTGAIPALQVLSCGTFFRLSYKCADVLVRSLGAVYRHAARQGLYTAAVVLGSLAGSRFGLQGVALAVTVALMLNYLTLSHLGLRLLNLSWSVFIRAHFGALWVSSAVLASTFPVLEFMRARDTAPLLVLGASAAAAGLGGLAGLAVMPHAVSPSLFPWLVAVFRPSRFGCPGRAAQWLLARSWRPAEDVQLLGA